jgi:hypothetical protein
MSYQDQFRQFLEAADIDGVRRLWEHVHPHLPAPIKDQDVLVSIHMARTQMVSIAFKLRAYSHRWLVDNGYPSQLPDELKPRAERLYPRIVEAVGISVKASHPLLKPVAASIERAMADAVEDAFASGRKDHEFVSARMREARERTERFYAELLAGTAAIKRH